MTEQNLAASLRQLLAGRSFGGFLLVLFGVLAVGSPFVAAVTVTVFIAWLIIFGGVVHLVLAFHAHRAGSILWKLLVGLAYVAIGGYTLMHPVLAWRRLTLLLASLFLIEACWMW